MNRALKPTARRAVTEPPESYFQAQIIDLFRATGWRVYHTHDSRRSEPGFPDLVCVSPEPGGGIVYAEIKRQRGRVSPAQEAWIEAIGAAGGEAHVWRPDDWDRIVERANRRWER